MLGLETEITLDQWFPTGGPQKAGADLPLG